MWATDVTYHILTLPIDNSIYHMKAEISGKRLEAFKVTVKGQSQLELPAQYKSPLVGSFTYYAASDVTESPSAVKLFDATNNQNKAFYYTINGGASAVSEGTTLSGAKADYYVVYTYNASNTIAQLDGSVKYNIKAKGYDKGKEVEKGFFAYNRGRNNRPAVLPKTIVDPEMLASEDFMKVDVSGTSVSPYWSSGDNKNKEAITGSKFHFMFEFVGSDPYNIIIRTAYAKDSTYIEKNDNSNPAEFVYKYYKKGSLFSNGTANTYFASDEHRHYNYTYNSSLAENPTNLEECVSGEHDGWDARNGYYHGQKGTLWNSFALLKNSESTYLFMATRTVGGDGSTPASPYFLKEANTCNNLVINQVALDNATNNLTIEGIYPIKKLTFKVVTPFGNVVSVLDQVSQYTVENGVIETKYLPDALKRKYIEFNGKFYKDEACTQEITEFSQADYDNTEGYKVYVGYNVSASAPKFLSPSASYTTATWYELTDDGSVQESGRKIKNNSGTYKNNGANGEFVKESEFAFVGDPYELKVLYREGSNYVTLGGHDTWEMPYDATTGSFLLREYNGTGYWNWNTGHVSADVAYHDDPSLSKTDKNAQTVTINISGLDVSKYYGITAGGAGASQIVSVTPELNNVKKVTGTTMTIVVKIAENKSGEDKTMTLTFQQYNNAEGSKPSESPANPSVITITQGTATSAFKGNTVECSTISSTRVKVLELPKRTYTYNIVDKSGRIAVKATASQTIFSALSLASIPSIIVSPFLLGETVTFYDDNYVDGNGRGSLTSSITETPNVADDIYVTYTTTNLVNKPIKLSEDQEFNVVLNGQYVYFNGSSLSTKTAPTPADLKDKNFLWKLRNRDPYAMLIDNMGAREVLPSVAEKVAGQSEYPDVYDDNGTKTNPERQKGAWIDVATIENAGALSFTTTRADAQRFVAKASTNTGVYEVMVATGDDVDASSTYYNIGRPAENTVKIYYNDVENDGYVHGSDVLKFRLEQTIPYTYHLIDKSNHELLTLTSQSPDLALPEDYQSPLVGTYHYYAENDINKAGDVYTVKADPTPLTILADLNATYTKTPSTPEAYGSASEGYKLEASDDTDLDTKAKKLTDTEHDYYFKVNNGASYYKVHLERAYRGTHIYVTYDANDIVKFGNTSQYTLKFLEPFAEGYYLEDGNDKLTSTKLQAVYPYTNGDGNLNIYSQAMKDEQMAGGASTRPRWVWYFNSTNNNQPDPYHVRIHSRSTISYNGVSHPTYLQTYAVHFNQDAEGVKKVVTGGTLPGIASTTPTEYMILGSKGAYKLLTTQEISDGITTERRKVTSLEQYWKTYNMVKLDVLDISSSTDEYSEDESTWVVPDDKRDDLATAQPNWHSYDAFANATRWNGYNDKSSGHEKKVVEKLEHWFQTFDMGNGTFDIESADIPPVLVLLDLHGWEIMRLPLPTTNYPEGDTELAALRAYDSPMVDKYYFYSNATKATGCHKYSLRLNDKKEERDQIKVNGEHYTSTSLGNLPPASATGVKSGNEFNDQFVTYTVKEEYAKSYSYNYSTGTETASKYLILLASRFLRDNGGDEGSSYNSKPIYEASNPTGGNVYDAILDPQQNTVQHVSTCVDSDKDGNIDNVNLWYVQPNQSIDKEMGIKYASTTGNTGEPWTEAETKKYYQDNGKDGFDPYNLQFKNAENSKFLTSHMLSTRLSEGIMIGNYEGSGGSENITLVAEDTTYPDPMESTGSTGYDHTNIAMTNQTFMAVSDANGNMQLMPRFDHTKRFNLVNNEAQSFSTLKDPVNHAKASAENNSSMGNQTVFFVRPERLEYHIIDNEGKESLRYKRAGDEYPTVTAHFKSPLAKDFTYYTGLAVHGDVTSSSVSEWGPAPAAFKRTATTASLMNTQINLLPTAGTYYYQVGLRGDFSYYKVTVTKGLEEQKINGALAAETLGGGDVYVRYDYDEDADQDADQILGGKWFTVKLANKDLQADGKVMKFIKLVANDDAYTAAKEALSSEGEYYFRIGMIPAAYTYKKVTVSDEGASKEEETITAEIWNSALTLAGLGVDLYTGSKPGTVGEEQKVWQWKFLAVLANPISDYYEKPDPYNVRIYNRYANYTKDPSLNPNPMNIGIKVPNANNGADHFALLSHPDGGYALAVAGLGTYDYTFLNGASMTAPDAGEPVAATTATEASFTQKTGTISAGSQIILNNDVKHNFVYNVINKAKKLAVSATQDEGAAEAHNYFPYLPEAAQSPLLRIKDYKYYGSAIPTSPGYYNIIPYSIVYTLSGGYDDVVWVHYDEYSVDSTEYKIPNKKTIVDSHVAKDPTSVDVSLNINGELPYNIIWYNDNMMSTEGDETTTIYDGGSQDLSGLKKNVWYIVGNDPYALKIRHKESSNYVDGTATLVADAADAKEFMLLKKTDYDYGILQETAGTNKLTFGDVDSNPGTPNTFGMTPGDPTKFIIFGLSIHNLIYHLVIAKSCPNQSANPLPTDQYVDIPYSEKDENGNWVSGYSPADNKTKRIYGTTQRDLTSVNTGDGTHYPGEKYQLGETLPWGNPAVYHTYCHDAGPVSIGDDLVLPNIFYRPNCKFDFYIEGIYQHYSTDNDNEGKPYTDLENKYKGLKLDKLMSDEALIDQDVVVNVVYSFDTGLETNSGDDFVTKMEQAGSHYLWYTFETTDATPQLAHYTFVRGMRAESGRMLHYTNDYLWSPLGDPYGFRMYNRYIYKNKGESTTVMTTDRIEDGQELKMGAIADDNRGIYELLPSGNIGTGSFRVHPLLDTGNTLFLRIVESGAPGDIGKLILSDDTPVKEWTYGLSVELLNPHYQGAGNVGGLTITPKSGSGKSGKALYEEAQTTYADKPAQLIRALQQICYNKDNIVDYAPGYYRLCNQPGASSLSPQRYASGYLHDIEKTAGTSSTPIPMHFYSKVGVTGTFDGDTNPLGSGFTETDATRGDIPIPATEYDPSTIFQFTGAKDAATMQTQGLYVQGTYTDERNGFAKMTASAGSATSFHVEDIGGAVVIIYNEVKENEVTKRRYINYGQNASIYDLKYYENADVDGSKWCMEPANKQGLKIATNQGGDNYYYATFYAPFDVLISDDVAADIEKEITAKNYYAYYCKTWDNAGLHPTAVPAATVNAVDVAEGKFVPAETPVIIRTTDESNVVTLTLPTTSPTASSISTELSGTYLEKLLPVDASHDVYTLGLPFTSGGISIDRSTGVVTAPLKESATTGVGFYINATPNKEHDPLQSLWQRNNLYVLHNKIYYRASSGVGGDARENNMTGIQFVPVIFGDEEEPDPNFMEQTTGRSYPAGVFNLQGQQIATEQEIEDGTWRQRVAPGIYIVNGKKIAIK